jgi:hypothetical protein
MLGKKVLAEAERIKEWAILTNGSQADYYRFRKIYLVKVLGKAVI